MTTNEIVQKEKIRNQMIENMMSNFEYIEWLIEFTQNKYGFYDDEWIYFPEEIEENEAKKVKQLCLFYEGIYNYAKQNHIYPTPCRYGNFYKVKLNESGFEIGFTAGQGTVFFCKKTPVENSQEFIDFNDIVSGKKQIETDRINEILDSLSEKITEAYESGVPIESIIDLVETIASQIKKQEKSKVLIKK